MPANFVWLDHRTLMKGEKRGGGDGKGNKNDGEGGCGQEAEGK